MLIKVKVTPEAKKDGIVKRSEDSYLISVREKAEGGMANQKVKLILAGYFKIAEGKIRLIKGGKRPNKIFEVMNW
ncbi:MAG: DUF167 domain-containing protein [Patescibacteria group bacterium]|jgi:uncharacterized protein YggU (UPF0235/DUF167 family)